MKLNPASVFEEYSIGTNYKASLGNRGLFEQARINERFFIGDQWYGAKCGNERPLVRHNVIKRIGDYKMSQILSAPTKVSFSVEGADVLNYSTADISRISDIFSAYFSVTAERLDLSSLLEKALRNSYISGTGLLYTYWDTSVSTGFFADTENTVPIKGDICCEILSIENTVFGDPFTCEIQKQPYIIIKSRKDTEEVIKEARLNGAGLSALSLIDEESADGKVNLYTKLYKKYENDGSYNIFACKTTEKATVKSEFDTGLSYYPLTSFKWETKNNSAYGESEITYLIPNQIAINRMITASVWSSITTGMPIMVVNGDTVTDKITNDPAQIIKVYGSNEDVAGAIKYISPPSLAKDFAESIDALINNTLTQSGANEVALGDSRADNAAALIAMRDSALMPLQTVKRRFQGFIEELARIWADFWITYYGKRKLCISINDKSLFEDFDAENYKRIMLSTKIDTSNETLYSDKECLNTLITLFEKGVINRSQLLHRIPKGIVPNISGIINDERNEADDSK